VKYIVVGAGYTGLTLAKRVRARGSQVTLTTRKADLAAQLRAEGYDVVSAPVIHAHLLPCVDADTHVVATHQPDAETDDELSRWASRAGRVTRVSSTSVYGMREGVVNEASPLALGDPRAEAQRAGEEPWQGFATVLRAAGIYGETRGSHTRIFAGSYAMPGDGTRYVSRIHVEDLARAILEVDAPGHALLAADEKPATHFEVAQFICQILELPMPECVALENVHVTLRGNRQIDASKLQSLLHAPLTYPSYLEGLAFLASKRSSMDTASGASVPA
jgi:nucleoside-diphosphate-sugar epimerase